jgi:hypothetical protein
LVEKPEENRPLGRPTHIRKDNIRMDLRGIGWEDVDWMHLTQNKYQQRAVVNTIINLRFP